MSVDIDDQEELEGLRREWNSIPRDLLSIVGLQRSEDVHSSALAWLLNPRGPHGLGTIFLAGFLRECSVDVSPDELAHATISREEEARVAGKRVCRADIVIHMPTVRLVVEAKIDAAESDRQCESLVRAFSRDTGVRRSHFAFLTIDGRAPETAAREKAGFALVSYSRVVDLLADAIQSSDDRVDSRPGSPVFGCLAGMRSAFGSGGATLDDAALFYLRNQATIDGWIRDRKKVARRRGPKRDRPRLAKSRIEPLRNNDWLVRQWSALQRQVTAALESFYESTRPPLESGACELHGEPLIWPAERRTGPDQYIFLHRDHWRGSHHPRVGVGLSRGRTSVAPIVGIVVIHPNSGHQAVRDVLGRHLVPEFGTEVQMGAQWPVRREFRPRWNDPSGFLDDIVGSVVDLWQRAHVGIDAALAEVDGATRGPT